MASPEETAKEIISQHFDCSDDKNVGKGGNGGLNKNEIRAVYQYTGQSGDPASEILNPILRHIAKFSEEEAKKYLENSRKKSELLRLKYILNTWIVQ